MIWGTSTDDSLGEDAKVTILATGIDNEFTEPKEEKPNEGDEHFEQLIKDLYKPVKKSKQEDKKVEEEKEIKETEPPFVVVAPTVEPAAAPVKEEGYYIISGHARIDSPQTTKTWYKRLKVINLPRHLVVIKAQ